MGKTKKINVTFQTVPDKRNLLSIFTKETKKYSKKSIQYHNILREFKSVTKKLNSVKCSKDLIESFGHDRACLIYMIFLYTHKSLQSNIDFTCFKKQTK